MTAVLRIYEDHTSIVVEMLGAGPGAVAAAIQAAYDSQASAVIAVAASEAAVDAAGQVLPAAETVITLAGQVDTDAQAVETARGQVAGNALLAQRQTIGAVGFSATLAPFVLTEIINGVTVTTTFGAGSITEVYGAPINETWVTTIAAGTVTKEKV